MTRNRLRLVSSETFIKLMQKEFEIVVVLTAGDIKYGSHAYLCSLHHITDKILKERAFQRLIELRLISKKLHVSIQTKICACVRSLCAWLPACHLHSSSERRWPWWMACKDSCMLEGNTVTLIVRRSSCLADLDALTRPSLFCPSSKA
ncbi:hypothetical protein NC653_036537 [Populus alba x Populus x berolinensis]|uniref:Uncharacterized protein n=1 Tax=Populus alba x Populus x berolinensis TaxID=444605 RepID=A0AAD6LKA3_9ROSI|nr:hypothetical protein NC653_036537 [Populus alba x Populus x berolinensis]